MNFKPMILPILLGGMLATVHLLPEAGEMASSAVSMELPDRVGSWALRKIAASEDEVSTLATDTRFSKAICLKARKGEVDANTGEAIPDRIDLSIVLSGHDLNNSIHRPERCMPSQGHLISTSSNASLELANGRRLTAKRLLSVQSIPTNEAKTEFVSFNCVTYYFFVGHDRITQDHLKRTLFDIKDRLFLGMDQHWAYVSVSMWYGKLPWMPHEIPIEEADTKLRQFISELTREQIDWKMVR